MAGKHTTVNHLILNDRIWIGVRDAWILRAIGEKQERIEIKPA